MDHNEPKYNVFVCDKNIRSVSSCLRTFEQTAVPDL